MDVQAVTVKAGRHVTATMGHFDPPRHTAALVAGAVVAPFEVCDGCRWPVLCAADRVCAQAEQDANRLDAATRARASHDRWRATGPSAGIEALERMDAGEPQQPDPPREPEPESDHVETPAAPKTRGPGRATRWTREKIIAALQADADRRGRPPTANEWRTTDGNHPTSSCVTKTMGSWNAALEAACFQQRPQGYAAHVKQPEDEPPVEAEDPTHAPEQTAPVPLDAASVRLLAHAATLGVLDALRDVLCQEQSA